MNRVVVTGMGALTPIGHDVTAYRDALMEGVCGIAPITRFDTADSKYTLAAEVKDFDPSARLDKAVLRKTDRFTQYALWAAEEAMAQSGLTAEGAVDPDRFGVYFGSGIGGFETFCEEDKKLLEQGARKVSPQFISKMISNIAAGNLAIRYGAHGPCVAITTACATGTTAIGEAYRTLAGGYADAILCGGSEASITPLAVAGFANCMALTQSDDPNAASLPFDARRGGFVMGEGAGVLVLERAEHAIARGATILCEVVGYGSTCDAHHVTAPDPSARCSARAIKEAFGDRDLARETVYFNAHGTGTPMNDTTETTALKATFGEDGAKQIIVSSTKSMTGHMLGAAGAVEAIAAILALREGLVPPTINLREPDPACDLDYTPNTARQANVTLALSNSLGFGGHNACVAFARWEG
ncbi:MAG: beta-ketoacyl-ACP synthase II [Clostridia bacterium]|nr:beta-ketoacyl-ACP synthase II [Clostridia bacterium]